MNAIRKIDQWIINSLDWFVKVFTKIGLIRSYSELSARDLSELNPNHITVSAISRVMRMSPLLARLSLDACVRQGVFKKVDDYYVLATDTKETTNHET